MEAVFEMPDDAIAHPEIKFGKNGIEDCIQRYDGASIDIIADLSTDTPSGRKHPYTFADNRCLLSQIGLQLELLFVFLTDVVGRRGHNELDGAIGDGLEQIKTVPREHHDVLRCSELLSDWVLGKYAHELDTRQS